MSVEPSCNDLENQIENLNEQLDMYHLAIKKWRAQWSKDGNEIARLREQLKKLGTPIPGAAEPEKDNV